MPLFRALAKNMATNYFGKNYLTVFPQKYNKTPVCTILWYGLAQYQYQQPLCLVIIMTIKGNKL